MERVKTERIYNAYAGDSRKQDFETEEEARKFLADNLNYDLEKVEVIGDDCTWYPESGDENDIDGYTPAVTTMDICPSCGHRWEASQGMETCWACEE